MLKRTIVVSCMLLLMHIFIHSAGADLIIFSYNRPLQLYALLESIMSFMSGIEDISVIYRSDDAFDQGYQIVMQEFPYVHYFKQSKNPQQDFKKLTLEAFKKGKADYILFGVDDIVVKDYVNIVDAIAIMQKYDVYGCFLRLSPLIDYLYSWQQPQCVPQLQKVAEGYMWQFCHASPISDWGYPHTVDMTIYKKSDIVQDILKMGYHNPNSMEATWSGLADTIRRRCGFCYETSKIVNLPLNLVQNSFNNPHMSNKELEPAELLKIFLSGKKMDIEPLFQIKNRSVHMEYHPTYVCR